MYVIFLQCTHRVEKTLIVSCTLLCESGERVKVDQSSFSAYLHAVMLHHVITARSMTWNANCPRLFRNRLQECKYSTFV